MSKKSMGLKPVLPVYVPVVDLCKYLLVVGVVISHQFAVLNGEPVTPKSEVTNRSLLVGFLNI